MARGESAAKRRARGERAAALIAGYRPLAGAADELIDLSGTVRPHWGRFVETLAGLGVDEVARRFQTADRHLRDSGVVFRAYDGEGGAERPWPLSHVPVLIGPEEWRHLEAGLVQRAELMDAILADAYGEGKLPATGALPAAVIAGSEEYLRPLVGAKPIGGHHLRIYAADVGRGPDGRWWVISDRAQAPSGAGYALENRLALSRALPEIYRGFHVERLAGFFQAFRGGLNALNRHDTRVALLTPGPLNETYFEHAYLARYLGFVLVEGDDLTVRDDAVYLRTISGLRPIDVILRRLDSDFADPLELNPSSKLGVPGLARAVRNRQVAIANALGSGLVESKALLGFLPALARRILGRDLILPNVATWWCGQTLERDHVIENLDRMVIAPALGARVAGVLDRGPVLGADLGEAARAKLVAAIGTRGTDFVGQEVVRLSTTPVWHDGRLVPRPCILRLYVARTESGWKVMPGGFCRISEREDARAVTLQQGGASADVWVLSDKPVAETTLIPSPDEVALRRLTANLPSRAAENLFWLGRYVERTETTLRLARAIAARIADEENERRAIRPLMDMLWPAREDDPEREAIRAAPDRAVRAILSRGGDFGGVPALATWARRAASVIRDRLSPDAWRVIADLEAQAARPLRATTEVEIIERIENSLRLVAAFSGLVQENMVRHNGWRFLDLGRRIERGIAVATATRFLGGPEARGGRLEALLELADSQIVYRIRYEIAPAAVPVTDLVLLDPGNPRSLAFQAERIRASLENLPGHAPNGMPAGADRIATLLSAELATADAARLDAAAMLSYERRLMQISDEIALVYFTHRRPAPPLGDETV
ncbi:circularly permuted type 2 ATP-grasp protein [Prosthecomicrobium pneumaticum]|uniref:Putative circularly permuted ATP-grasp superfamily protein/putative alpha-E superfamily protein n=1 Tax=Prosthecomicrobium pneumaticum TaxID=81895 RepID=A0A7W9FP26_9HYPH|nr:circularly permuted type 2 ATP-grasp protein [Prosthecomicrobium pneumaticum]MBB5754185.1 putative circularly permuted ATP-grasp superfamily protein/putative alpha-E superfamily protein [Prosthecomicrobium pneumaticum]